MPFYGKMSEQQFAACRIIFLPKMRSIIPSGKKMRKRIAKYPIPNFKIQMQFLNRNGEQFAFAVKSPGRFLPFRKKQTELSDAARQFLPPEGIYGAMEPATALMGMV